MSFIIFFEKITREKASIVGGKGASLGEMTKANLPVPPGFVVLTNVFERFLNETKLDTEIDATLDTIEHGEIHTIENAAEKIQTMILDKKIPNEIANEIMAAFNKLNAKWVAVRSSATSEDNASAAWAGQLDSYLNTSEKKLLTKIRCCWASLFNPRAIFYRFEKALNKQKISVAVVVQKMVESEVSGIAFSVHPVTQDTNQLIIEAGYGLGEAIVSGQITPDSYVVAKKEKVIIECSTAKQEQQLIRKSAGGNAWVTVPVDKQQSQKLSDKQIMELSKLVVKIERHYGFPCDIEWVYEKGRFYITQSRPITTLSEKAIGTMSVKPTRTIKFPFINSFYAK